MTMVLEPFVLGPTELPFLIDNLADGATPHLGIAGAVQDDSSDGCLPRLGLTTSLMIDRLGETIKLTKLRETQFPRMGVRQRRQGL